MAFSRRIIIILAGSLVLLSYLTRSAAGASEPAAASSGVQDEAQLLLAFKQGIVSDPLGRLASWAVSSHSSAATHPCTAAWSGIVCDAQKRHVTAVNLASSNLSGSISPSLALLPALLHLNLSRNLLYGGLPSSLFLPHRVLQCLDLSFNLLNESLPDSFANLSALLTLDLSFNHFVGGIPSSLGRCQSLERLYIAYSGLVGRIPSDIWQLPALTELWIAGDSLLEAVLPKKFPSCPSLRALALSNVNATGSAFPSSLGDCQQLRNLVLDVIGLDGIIPAEVWQLPSLRQLVVSDSQVQEAIDKDNNKLAFKLHGSFPSSILPFCQTIEVLVMDGINLTGEIPPYLGQCSSLRSLDLSHGMLQGGIPKALGNLGNLQRLHLQSHRLSGTIPKELFQCSGLQSIRFGGNTNLSGAIPKEVGELKHLVSLSLFSTSLWGPLPVELGQLSILEVLDLSKNMLTGHIPTKALENCTNLQILRLAENNLSGRIDQFDLSKLQNLTTFTLQQNNFTGDLPRGFTSSRNLQLFDVRRNSLSGSLPSDHPGIAGFTGLTNLRVLVLGYNKLSGEIPGWLWNLPMLQVLDLSNNRFSGSMPTTVTHLGYFKQNQSRNSIQSTLHEEVEVTDKFTYRMILYILSTRIVFDVSMNSLEGMLSESFGELLGLTTLNLSHNRIQGNIPKSLGNLHSLDQLDLSHNYLTGCIPDELGGLGTLSVVDLSYNDLQGPIPSTSFFNTRYNYTSFEGNPGLCGTPLLVNCSYNKPPIINNESEPHVPAWSFISWICSFASPWAVLITYPIGFFGGLYFVYRMRIITRYYK